MSRVLRKNGENYELPEAARSSDFSVERRPLLSLKNVKMIEDSDLEETEFLFQSLGELKPSEKDEIEIEYTIKAYGPALNSVRKWKSKLAIPFRTLVRKDTVMNESSDEFKYFEQVKRIEETDGKKKFLIKQKRVREGSPRLQVAVERPAVFELNSSAVVRRKVIHEANVSVPFQGKQIVTKVCLSVVNGERAEIEVEAVGTLSDGNMVRTRMDNAKEHMLAAKAVAQIVAILL